MVCRWRLGARRGFVGMEILGGSGGDSVQGPRPEVVLTLPEWRILAFDSPVRSLGAQPVVWCDVCGPVTPSEICVLFAENGHPATGDALSSLLR